MIPQCKYAMTMTEENAKALFHCDNDLYNQTGTLKFKKISESRCGVPGPVKGGEYILVVANKKGGQMALGIIRFHQWGTYSWFVGKYGEDRLSDAQKEHRTKWNQIMVARESFSDRVEFVHPVFFGGDDLQMGFRNSVVWEMSERGQGLVAQALNLLDDLVDSA